LDELPETAVDNSFGRTTIEMVTVAARADLSANTASLPIARRYRTLLLTALCAVAATVGFAATRLLTSQPSAGVPAELPEIELADVDVRTLHQDERREAMRISEEDARALRDEAVAMLQEHPEPMMRLRQTRANGAHRRSFLAALNAKDALRTGHRFISA
jgi:hypothetical protein